MKRLLQIGTIIILGAVVSSCDSGFLNPKQFNIQVLEGEGYSISVSHTKHNLIISDTHPADGFNIKRDDEIKVGCTSGDSVLVFIAGDVRNGGEHYFSSGDNITFVGD